MKEIRLILGDVAVTDGYQSCGCSRLQLGLPVLSEEVDDVQRRSVYQPDSQVKGCFPMFLKQKA